MADVSVAKLSLMWLLLYRPDDLKKNIKKFLIWKWAMSGPISDSMYYAWNVT